jgi:hypothetical protein
VHRVEADVDRGAQRRRRGSEAETEALAFAVDKERVGRWQAVGMALAVPALVLVTLSRQ